MKHATIILASLLLLSACQYLCRKGEPTPAETTAAAPRSERGIYFWKSTFCLNDRETDFLREHGITRMYVKMFDVAPDRDWDSGEIGVFPIATTRFVSKVPEGISITPTVYITLEALLRSKGEEEELAQKIVTRVLAMASYNHLGRISMVQFDCDWTASTRDSYFALCNEARKNLKTHGLDLSGTVRLHQVAEESYPFSHNILMLYNTGNLKNPDTRNSIIDYDEIRKYLKPGLRAHEFDVAYPTFSWTAHFTDGQFSGLRHGTDIDPDSLKVGETIRTERSEISEILKVKALAGKTLGTRQHSTIIYHLDSDNLSNYTHDEIESIYSR